MPTSPETTRLAGQLEFIETIDHLKQIYRRNLVTGGWQDSGEDRRENTAEHSWHIAVSAMVLAEYAAEPPDVPRVVQMLVVHDLIEVYAGDTFCYDETGYQDKAQRERESANRIFGLLPKDQETALRGLWEEFEAGTTVDARFANVADRFQVLLQNRRTNGGTWRIYEVRREQVLKRMAPIHDAAPGLWPTVLEIIDKAHADGLLKD